MAVSVRFVNNNRKVKTSFIKSRINDEYAGKIWFKKTYWDIDVIERRELINSMNLTEEEKLIMNDIVLDVEELAVDYLNNDKLGIIPYLGTFKLNGGIKNIAKHSEELKAAKKAGATKEELKDMQLQLYIEGVKKDEQLTKEEKDKASILLKESINSTNPLIRNTKEGEIFDIFVPHLEKEVENAENSKNLGAVLDIGTTTLAACLIDKNTGETLLQIAESEGVLNSRCGTY